MFDHIGLNVKDYAASRAFYEQAFAPLGYGVVMAFEEWKACAFGPEGKPAFWIAEREPHGTGTHVALTAADHATVDAFHAAGVSAGGTDNGGPGSASSITRRITPRSCTTSTATTSKSFVTERHETEQLPGVLIVYGSEVLRGHTDLHRLPFRRKNHSSGVRR